MILVCDKKKMEVTPEYAQRILFIQKGMGTKNGWELPKDSPYEFKNNALIERTNKRVSKAKATRKRDTSGSKSSEQA